MQTTFRKLNEGWDAEPNVPCPETSSDGSTLYLRFRPNTFLFPALADRRHIVLGFSGCCRYRFTTVNDEGWYRGQCRFSHIAPDWGEFYEIEGDFMEAVRPEKWIELGREGPGIRNYLFYFRDETFECQAENWAVASDDAGRKYQEPNQNV